MAQNGLNLQFVQENFLSDIDVVLKAVEQDVYSLQFASEEMQ